MADYIDREDAIECVIHQYCASSDETEYALGEAIEEIQALPSADVKPVVHGKWIDMGDFEQCSVCKGTHLKEFQSMYGKVTWVRTDFCPNCGADMREVDNG